MGSRTLIWPRTASPAGPVCRQALRQIMLVNVFDRQLAVVNGQSNLQRNGHLEY